MLGVAILHSSWFSEIRWLDTSQKGVRRKRGKGRMRRGGWSQGEGREKREEFFDSLFSFFLISAKFKKYPVLRSHL